MNLPFDINTVATPAFVVDRELLIHNLEILRNVKTLAGCKIILAQKAFSMFYFYPLIGQYLDGTCASGLYEAKLGYEHMGGENHVFSAAYRPDEFAEITKTCDHILFNSLAQWERYSYEAIRAGCSCGIRINPEHSTQDHAIYDPCSPGSRLGVTLANMPEALPNGVEGLHFHTLCEQDSDALEVTLNEVEEKFGKYLSKIKWLNFGGGHHITKAGYDIERLIKCVKHVRELYGVEVYLEPGEAVALNAGFLVSTVLDITCSGDIINAILDTSAACHMPDVIEMPYRPPLLNSGESREKQYTYRLSGPTCLAGDIIGDYSFDSPLAVGSRVAFGDMAIYSMVKTNTFNGMPLPSLYASESGKAHIIRSFGYCDFKNRLS